MLNWPFGSLKWNSLIFLRWVHPPKKKRLQNVMTVRFFFAYLCHQNLVPTKKNATPVFMAKSQSTKSQSDCIIRDLPIFFAGFRDQIFRFTCWWLGENHQRWERISKSCCYHVMISPSSLQLVRNHIPLQNLLQCQSDNTSYEFCHPRRYKKNHLSASTTVFFLLPGFHALDTMPVSQGREGP